MSCETATPICRSKRCCATSRTAASPPGSTGSANKEGRRGKTRRRHLFAHCHGAQTRLGLRGGGRLPRLSPERRRAAFIVCCTAAPGRQRAPFRSYLVTCLMRDGDTHLLKQASLRDVAHRSVAAREHRFRKQGRSARQNASPTAVAHCHGAQTRLGLRGGVGSAFCPLTPSRRLHCLLHRRSRPATRTVALLARKLCMRDGDSGLLK